MPALTMINWSMSMQDIRGAKRLTNWRTTMMKIERWGPRWFKLPIYLICLVVRSDSKLQNTHCIMLAFNIIILNVYLLNCSLCNRSSNQCFRFASHVLVWCICNMTYLLPVPINKWYNLYNLESGDVIPELFTLCAALASSHECLFKPCQTNPRQLLLKLALTCHASFVESRPRSDGGR